MGEVTALALRKIKNFDLSQGHCVVQAIFRVFTEKAQIYSTSATVALWKILLGELSTARPCFGSWYSQATLRFQAEISLFNSVGAWGRGDKKCSDGFGRAPYLLCCWGDQTSKKVGKHWVKFLLLCCCGKGKEAPTQGTSRWGSW